MNLSNINLAGHYPTEILLGYFLDYPDRGFYGGELSRELDISVGAVHGALTKLYRQGILKREPKGKTLLYSLNEEAPIAKILKIIRTLEMLTGLINELSPYTREVYLFGSSAAGEYVSESDIDLAVVARSGQDTQKIEALVSQYKLRRKVQLLLFTVIEWETLETKDPAFYGRITKGINIYNQQLDGLELQEMS